MASGSQEATLSAILGVIAVVFATVNIVGGFMVTDRMLGMFKRDREKRRIGEEK